MRGTIVGTALLVVVATGLIAPRTFAFGFPAFALVVTAAAAAEGRLATVLSTLLSRPLVSWDNALLLSGAAFFAYAAVSALWAHSPVFALQKATIGACIALFVLICARIIVLHRPDDVPARMADGLWMGFFFGSTLLAAEVATGQAIKIAVINALGFKPGQLNPAAFFTWQENRVVAIWISDLTRNMPPLAMMVAPAIAAALARVRRPWSYILISLIVTLTTLAIFGSDSQTAQLALIVGFVVLGFSIWSMRWTSRLLMVVWVSACLLVVPLGYGLGALERAYGLSAHDASRSPWLARQLSRASVGARMAILGVYARRIFERPVLGHGANMSYVLGPIFDATEPKDNSTEATMRQHPHNGYMQIWFDLGAIGALLFALVGLQILCSIATLTARSQSLAYGTFAIVATTLATSYGVWQYWLMAALALCAVTLTVAVASQTAVDRIPNSSGEV